jgi:hypothetical protein
MTNEQILATADACGMMKFSQGWNKEKFKFCLLAFAKQILNYERHEMLMMIEAVYDSQDPNAMYQEGYNHALSGMEEFIKARNEA